MSVQSERAGNPAPAVPRRGTSGPPNLAATAPAPRTVAEQWWRPGDGLALFVSFGIGIVLVVVAVALIEAVEGWWVLAPVMGLVFTLAALVTAGIMLLLADDGETDEARSAPR